MPGPYTLKEAAKLVGVHKLTLRRWEKEGRIPTPQRWARTPSRRAYSDADIEAILRWKTETVPASVVSQKDLFG